MSGLASVAAAQVLLPDGLRARAAVDHCDGRIVSVRDAGPDDIVLDGLLLPGLINAHTHTELTWARGRVPGGRGFRAWVEALFALTVPGHRSMDQAAAELAACGTAGVSDVCNGGDSAGTLAAAGLSGVVQHERLDGLDPARLESLGPLEVEWGVVTTRPSPHAVFSSSPALLQRCVSLDGPPASLHIAEDPAEGAFLADGTGPLADLLDHLGRDWRGWAPPGTDVVAYLDTLQVLGPRLLLVHGVHLDPAALRRVADRGASLCLCPRSNLHIGGRLPDVPAALAAGVRLCLGTDSLASSPDLDVLGEATVLAEAFPEVPPATWLQAATREGARALGLRHLGRIEPGTAPGLLFLPGVRGDRPLPSRAPRRWLVPPLQEISP